MEKWNAAENNILWKQFGNVMGLIHDVHGERFGLPLPGFQFDCWSQTVIDRFERVLHSAKEKQIHILHLSQILEIVRTHTEKLDEIQVPCLLHGDLWSFNLLVSHGENHPTIVGILASDRAWWGDPMADWTMFILAHAEKEEDYAHFWQAYGQPEETSNSMFRGKVYDTRYAGTAFT